MADIAVLNTTAQLSGKTLATLEGDWTITGLWSFDRDPSAPFAVSAGSAKVANLDVDLLDGSHWAAVKEAIVPDATNTRDLGSTGIRWRDLFLAGSLVSAGTTITLRGVQYTLPAADGTAGQSLNGAGTLSWSSSGESDQTILAVQVFS